MSELDQLTQLQKENKTLKEALRLACDSIYERDGKGTCPSGVLKQSGLALPRCQDVCPANFADCWIDHFLTQATPEGG